MQFRSAKWPENLKNSRAGKLMMWRRGLECHRSPTATPSSRWATGPTRARPTTPASTCRHSTAFMPSSSTLPDGPEREAALLRRKEALRRLCAVQVPWPPHRHFGRRIRGSSAIRRHPFMRDFLEVCRHRARRERQDGRLMRDAPDLPASPRDVEGRGVGRPWVAQRAWRSSGRTEDAPLCVRSQRNRLRSGTDQRPLLAHRHRRTSSTACTTTTISHGRSRSSRTLPTACQRSPTTSASGRFASSPGRSSRTTRHSKASHANWSPQTMSTH